MARFGWFATSVLAISLPVAAAAQDREAPQRLEDLIPDSAVENPDAWAGQGTDPDAPPPDADIDLEVPLADEMTDDLGIELAWPDEIELPPIEPLTPEPDIRFAEDALELPTETGDREEVAIGDELLLTFPEGEETFARQAAFIETFEALSTIEELDSGDENLARLGAQARADEELLGNLLDAYGYYDGRVLRTVGGRGEDTRAVRFDVLPGPRYRLGAVDLGALETQAPALRDDFGLRAGDPVSSFTIVEERADLEAALGEGGYPFAKVAAPELLVDHARLEADLAMPVQPGGRYVFGEVRGNQPGYLPGRHLETIARFDRGDPYQASLERDLRRAIRATGLVSSVTVTPVEIAPPVGDQPGIVALDVAMARAPVRTVTGAIGYGSEEGVRVAASWEHRNFFPPEGAVRVRGVLGTREQLLGVGFRRNNFGGRDQVLSLDAYATTFDSDAFEARTAAFVATYERISTLLYQKPFSWSVGLELIATQERDAVTGTLDPRTTYLIAALPVSAQIDTSDSLLDPSEGFRIGGRLSPEVSEQFGDVSTYLKGQVDGSYYQRINPRVVVAGRTRVATIVGAETFDIAPSRRLYAGGGASVRGYGYQSIGPRDSEGDPNGGRSLVEAAVEARIRTGLLDGAVSVVPFLDAGSVGRQALPDLDVVRFGAGVGLRYQTSFGPIRVDVGVPLNPGPDDAPVGRVRLAGAGVLMAEAVEAPRRGVRWGRWLVGVVLGLVALLAVGLLVLNSPVGKRFIAGQIADIAPASGLRFEVGRIEGDIWDEAVLYDVALSDPKGVFLTLPRVALDWRPLSWLTSGLDIRRLETRGGTLRRLPELLPGDPDAPVLPDFGIRVDRFVIDGLTVAPGVVTPEAQRIDLASRIDIRDARALVRLNGRFGDAGPDRRRSSTHGRTTTCSPCRSTTARPRAVCWRG